MIRSTFLSLLMLITFGVHTQAQTQEIPKFKNLIYHTSVCFGFCPVYHMEIRKNGKVFVHKEKIFDRDKSAGKNFAIDSTQIGYFKGKISKKEVRKINDLIRSVNLPALQTDSVLCCDGSLKTIISYIGGNRHYYQTMFPRDNVQELTNLLHAIAGKTNRRVKSAFKIEEVEVQQ